MHTQRAELRKGGLVRFAQDGELGVDGGAVHRHIGVRGEGAGLLDRALDLVLGDGVHGERERRHLVACTRAVVVGVGQVRACARRDGRASAAHPCGVCIRVRELRYAARCTFGEGRGGVAFA